MYTQKAIRRPSTKNTEPSKTDQTFKDDCDVNLILRRYMKTGDQSIFRQGGSYSDVSEVPDLLEAHLNLQRAKTAFDLLPSEIRKKLHNNPLMLEQYLSDPKNHEEAIELGLLNKKSLPEAHPQPNQKQELQTNKTKSNESAPENKNKKPTPQKETAD